MATSRGTNLQTGARVMSADGKQLGLVKEVRYDRFLVDVRWAPDYWLGTEAIENVADDVVQLTIAKAGIASAKLNLDVRGPGLT